MHQILCCKKSEGNVKICSHAKRRVTIWSLSFFAILKRCLSDSGTENSFKIGDVSEAGLVSDVGHGMICVQEKLLGLADAHEGDVFNNGEAGDLFEGCGHAGTAEIKFSSQIIQNNFLGAMALEILRQIIDFPVELGGRGRALRLTGAGGSVWNLLLAGSRAEQIQQLHGQEK